MLDKSSIRRQRDTSPNGDCGLNSVAIAMYDLAQQDSIPKISEERQQVILDIIANNTSAHLAYAKIKTWEDFTKHIKSIYGDRHVEKFLVPIFRQLLAKIIAEDNFTVKSALFKDNRDEDVKSYIYYYFRQKCGCRLSTDYKHFKDARAITAKFQEHFDMHIGKAREELAKINPKDKREAAEEKRYQELLEIDKIYKLLGKATDKLTGEEEAIIDDFMRPIIVDLLRYWKDEGYKDYAKHLALPGKWVGYIELGAVAHFFDLGYNIYDLRYVPINQAYNYESYPQEYLQTLTDRQLVLLTRFNLISPYAEKEYCQLNPNNKEPKAVRFQKALTQAKEAGIIADDDIKTFEDDYATKNKLRCIKALGNLQKKRNESNAEFEKRFQDRLAYYIKNGFLQFDTPENIKSFSDIPNGDEYLKLYQVSTSADAEENFMDRIKIIKAKAARLKEKLNLAQIRGWIAVDDIKDFDDHHKFNQIAELKDCVDDVTFKRKLAQVVEWGYLHFDNIDDVTCFADIPDGEEFYEISSLLQFEDFVTHEFDWETLIRLNFENNRNRIMVNFQHQGAHWVYLEPKYAYVNPHHEPEHLRYILPSPHSLNYCLTEEFDAKLADKPGKLDIAKSREYLAAVQREYTQNVRGSFSEEELAKDVDPKATSFGAACDALYSAIRFNDMSMDPAVLKVLLTHNKHYAGYYRQHHVDHTFAVNILHRALSDLDVESIRQIAKANPEALVAPPALKLAADKQIPIPALSIVLNNADCTPEIVKTLLDIGVPVTGVNLDGKTCLQVAIENGQFDIAMMLLQYRTPDPNNRVSLINKDKDGKSVLEYIDFSKIDLSGSASLNENIQVATQSLQEHLNILYEDAKVLSDSSTSKTAAIDLVTNIYLELNRLQSTREFDRQKATDYFLACQRIVARNTEALRNNEWAWQLTLNVVYCVFLVGLFHHAGYQLYRLARNESPALLFPSKVRQASTELESIFENLVHMCNPRLPAGGTCKDDAKEPLLETGKVQYVI